MTSLVHLEFETAILLVNHLIGITEYFHLYLPYCLYNVGRHIHACMHTYRYMQFGLSLLKQLLQMDHLSSAAVTI